MLLLSQSQEVSFVKQCEATEVENCLESLQEASSVCLKRVGSANIMFILKIYLLSISLVFKRKLFDRTVGVFFCVIRFPIN